MPASYRAGGWVSRVGLKAVRGGAYVSVYLQFSQREASTGADATVVFDGGASNDGAELVYWAGCDGRGLGETGLTTSLLATGLDILLVVLRRIGSKDGGLFGRT
jgi:hypothetical protein